MVKYRTAFHVRLSTAKNSLISYFFDIFFCLVAFSSFFCKKKNYRGIRDIKIKQLSGKKAQIYSVILGQEDQSVFEQFLQNNYSEYPTEIEDIVSKLKIMATKTGAAEHFFKLNEGKPGDGVCALFDSPDKKLRIYCIRFANVAIIVGGGGYKPKNIRAYQESSSLKKEAETVVRISRIISEAIKNKDIHLDDNGFFLGNLKLKEE
jgi:hypothetical protein